MAGELTHPDLHWIFPRERPKAGDQSVDDVRADFAELAAERVKRRGLYAPHSGSDGIFVADVRAIVHLAAISPAMSRRKLFVVGDAERMVPQTGKEEAANAFLKLLEEPPANTLIILTSSEPGALLPTIRSRVACVRVRPLSDADVRAFLADPAVASALGTVSDDRVAAAGGAPGALVAAPEREAAVRDAQRALDVVTAGSRADRLRFAFGRGTAGARGQFSDMLDELTVGLRDLAQQASGATGHGPNDPRIALGASRAVTAVEQAKGRAEGNVNPQLLTAWLMRELTESLR